MREAKLFFLVVKYEMLEKWVQEEMQFVLMFDLKIDLFMA